MVFQSDFFFFFKTRLGGEKNSNKESDEIMKWASMKEAGRPPPFVPCTQCMLPATGWDRREIQGGLPGVQPALCTGDCHMDKPQGLGSLLLGDDVWSTLCGSARDRDYTPKTKD